jgi:recombining binding protein (suppressor of hairless)
LRARISLLSPSQARTRPVSNPPNVSRIMCELTKVLIHHGSTIALFNRVRSQTASTRYLSVAQDFTKVLGSDGRPVIGARPPANGGLYGFVTNSNVWESFIIWLVDLRLPLGPGFAAPPQPDWPSAPANALHCTDAPPIRYNSVVVLQSLQTGLTSAPLIIRRIDAEAEAVGGDGTCTDAPASAGEMLGDPVSQLHKIAFEVYSNDPAYCKWLACDQENLLEQVVNSERRWSVMPTAKGSRPGSAQSTPSQRFGILPMTPRMNMGNLPPSPSSTASSLEHRPYSRRSSASLLSPTTYDVPLPIDGGPARRERASIRAPGPISRPGHRKAPSSSSVTDQYPDSSCPRMKWSMDVGDACVWSIVSTEQTTYTFYVPPHDGAPTASYAPFPQLTRALPEMGSEMPDRYNHQFTSMAGTPLVIL